MLVILSLECARPQGPPAVSPLELDVSIKSVAAIDLLGSYILEFEHFFNSPLPTPLFLEFPCWNCRL